LPGLRDLPDAKGERRRAQWPLAGELVRRQRTASELPEWGDTAAAAELLACHPDTIRKNPKAYGGVQQRGRGRWKYPLRRLAANPEAFGQTEPVTAPCRNRRQVARKDLLAIKNRAA